MRTIRTIVSGNTVDVQAGQNINVTGSHLVSTEGTTLLAGNDINLVNATDSRYENHYKKVKKSGLMSGGGLGVTIGSQTQSLDRKDTLYTASAATVGATEGNVNLIAGNTYTQKGSHVQAPEGDVNILAKRVDITDATETRHSTSEYRFKQSGLSISLSNPVLDVIQTGVQMANASRKADDGRMTALAVANTGLAANVAYEAVKAGQGDANGKIATKNPDGTPVKNADGTPAESDATAASQAGGITISVTVGTSKSESKTTIDATNSASSTVTAGNNVTIAAVGDAENSDLTVRGSDINAGNNILLAADNNINLLASANTTEQHSTSKNSSAALGVAIQIGQGVAFGITASASIGRGTADGSDVVWKNTHVNAGNTAELVSGNDTNLVGAVVNARQVVADIGNNLNITSLQDTSEYHSKSQSAGGSVTIGYGFAGSASYSQSKANSSYASVVEQSGIRAGDGGFQVAVANDTTLNAGVISSTQAAVDEHKNQFTTGGTLTLTDTHNHARYESKAIAANLGIVPSMNGSLTPKGSSAGIGKDSGSTQSDTLAGITEIAGNTSARTGDAETGIKPIFDANKVQEKIQAQVEIVKKFNELAPIVAANYAQSKIAELNSEIQQAGKDPEKKAALQAELNKWKPNGEYSVAMNIIIAAIGNGTTGVVEASAKEGLAWAAGIMRDAALEDSAKFPGVCDSNGNCFNNLSGESEGVNGDGKRVGGGRIDLDKLCERYICKMDGDDYAKDDRGRVLLSEENEKTLKEILSDPELRSPLGGVQGSKGYFLGIPYSKGDLIDKVVEGFAGTHDTLNSWYWYDDNGNIRPGMTKPEEYIGEVINVVNVPLAAPFALATLLPPQVWNAIGTVLAAGR